MKNLIHLFNILCWMAVPNLITVVLSFLFNFKYLDAVQSATFVVVYFIYVVAIIPVYCSNVADGDDSMAFIK